MTIRSKSLRWCATCEYWLGARRPDVGQERVEVANGAKGECIGQWKGSIKSEDAYCGGWRKWAVLK